MNSELDKVILYGAGTQNLRMAYQPIASAGYDVLAICDKDVQKQGKIFFGKEIISVERLLEMDNSIGEYLLVITARNPKVVEEIKNELQVLRNAKVFSFNDFIAAANLNSRVVRFSCIMVHLADDCNLNCVRCSHFSPLAERGKSYLSVEQFEQECKRLSELTAGDVEEFQLAGGEPMLHPQAHAFPYIIRKYFPKTQIVMITNGTLISKVGEQFWQSCRDNALKLMVTLYPLKIDYKQLRQDLLDKGIDFEFGNSGDADKENAKVMWGLPLTLEGGLNAKYNFDGCLCMQYVLRDGRLYPCANSAYIDLFNNYFNLKLPGPEANGVSLYEVKDLKELTEKISQPVPLCAYCDARKRMNAIPWAISKRELSEWILHE